MILSTTGVNDQMFNSPHPHQQHHQHQLQQYQTTTLNVTPSLANNLSFGTLESPDMNRFYAHQHQQALFFDHNQQVNHNNINNANANTNNNTFTSSAQHWLPTTLIGNRNGESIHNPSHSSSPINVHGGSLSSDSGSNYQIPSQQHIPTTSTTHFKPIIVNNSNNHSLKPIAESPSPSLESELNRYSNSIPSVFPASPSGRSSMMDVLGPPQKTKPDSKCASETILEVFANVNLSQCNADVLKVKLKVENVYVSDCKQWPVVSETSLIKCSELFKMEKPLIYHYKFHHLQKLCISISNENNEIIGECFLFSNDLITTSSALLRKNVYDENRINTIGSINIMAEESSLYNNLVTLQFSARNLDGKGYIQDTSDPYLVISKQDVEGFYEKVIVTEYKHTKNPTWKQRKIASFDISNTNFDTPLKIEVFDWNIDKRKHSFIGVFETTFNELKISQGREFSLVNERYNQNPNYVNSGIVKLDVFSIESRPNIYQYLKSGYSLDLIVNIDVNFEKNNLESFSSRYSQSIHMFGSMMENFRSKREHKLFYHRGKLRMDKSRVNQSCFEVVGGSNLQDQNLIAKQMILMDNIERGDIVPNGQVNLLAPIVHNARSIIKKQSISEKCYTTVLVLTHTDINDINSTIKELQQCSSIPMSVIVVGISESDNFANLVELDSRFRNYFEMNGNQTVRDLFTFCRFSNISTGLKSICEHFIQYVEQEGECLETRSITVPSPKLSFQEVPQQKRSYDIKF